MAEISARVCVRFCSSDSVSVQGEPEMWRLAVGYLSSKHLAGAELSAPYSLCVCACVSTRSAAQIFSYVYRSSHLTPLIMLIHPPADVQPLSVSRAQMEDMCSDIMVYFVYLFVKDFSINIMKMCFALLEVPTPIRLSSSDLVYLHSEIRFSIKYTTRAGRCWTDWLNPAGNQSCCYMI